MFSLHRTLSLRYLRRRWDRAALVVVSIAIGVATLVSTRALNRSMEVAARAAVTPLAGAADFHVDNGEAGVARALADELRTLPGVRMVQPLLVERVQLADLDNRVALLLGVELPNESPAARDNPFGITVQINNPAALLTGRPVLVGAGLAAELTGNTVHLRVGGRRLDLARLGTVAAAGPAAALGRNLLVMEIGQASRLLGRGDAVTRLDVFIYRGVDEAEVRRLAVERLHGRAEVRTPEAHGRSMRDVIAGVQVGFALCGAGALVVGLFLVYNALSVSVAERRHEIGVLRSLGATRGQIGRLFAGEAVLLGLAGSLLGLPCGLGLAWLALGPLERVMREVFMDVEVKRVSVSALTLVGSAVAGVLTALLAALVPASQAAADEPADAVRRVPSRSVRRWRMLQAAVSLALVAVGLGLAFARESLPVRLGSFGGLVLILLGALLAAPLAATLLARLLQPLTRRLPGVEVRLAADNLLRASGRTGVVVGALAAGVALVVQVAGIALSNERPILDWCDRTITADLFVMNGDAASATNATLPLSADVARQLERLPGVGRVLTARFRRLEYAGTVIFLAGIDAAAYHAANLGRPGPRGAELIPRLAEPNTALVSDNFAELHHVQPGDVLTLPGPLGPFGLRVVGTLEDYSWNRGTVLVDRATLIGTFHDDQADILDIYLQPGREAEGETAVRDFAAQQALFVMTRADLLGYIRGAIRRLFALITVQELVVCVVAALGVVTALLISVLQRQRELGLLRAVGATPAQVLRSVLAEATLLGVIGTLIGLAVGLPLEWYVLRVVIWEESGFLFPVLVPWRAGLAIAGLSVAAATLAGVGPALRALRVRVVEAIAYE